MSAAAEEQRAKRARARRRGAQDPTLVPHGTHSGYDYWGCRCAKCTGFVAAKVLEGRNRAVERHRNGDAEFEHGTTNGYGRYRCRCAACRGANAAYHRQYRRQRALRAAGGAQ